MSVTVGQHGFSDEHTRRVATLAYAGEGFWGRLQVARATICPLGPIGAHIPAAGGTMLDIGCGSGLFTLTVASCRKLDAIVAIDPSEAAIARARRALARVAPELLVDDVDFRIDGELAAAETQYDVVSLIDVMHHVPPRAQGEFLARAARAVRPGGRLLYKDMCERPLWRATANRMHDLVLARQWIHYLPLSTARDVLEQQGLRIVDSGRMNRLWYGHEYLVFERPA